MRRGRPRMQARWLDSERQREEAQESAEEPRLCQKMPVFWKILNVPIQSCVVPHLTSLAFLAPSLLSIPPFASSILPSVVSSLAVICEFLHQSMRFLRRLKQFF